MGSLKCSFLGLFVLSALVCVSHEQITSISIQQYDPPRLGTQAQLQCTYSGTAPLDLQLVTWFKLFSDGSSSFVYEYDPCAGTSKAFNELVGRATMTIVDPMESADSGTVSYDINKLKRKPRSIRTSGDIQTASQSSHDVKSFNDTKPSNSLFSSAKGSKSKNNLHQKSTRGVNALNRSKNSTKDSSKIADNYKGYSKANYREKRELHDLMKTLTGLMELEENSNRIDNGPQSSSASGNGEGVATLSLNDIRLEDEGVYECTIKVREAPPVSSSAILTVIVLPSTPHMEPLGKAVTEGDEIQLTCSANLGRPAGKVVWSRQRIGEMNFWAIAEDQSQLDRVRNENSTTSGVSTVTITMEAEDDGAIYKCETISDAMQAWEELPFDHIILDVYYPPRNGKILYDGASDRYYCHVQSKPAPSYVWLWIQEDGTKTIMSADQYLDMSSIKDGGYLRFRCLGSNVINGVRHTSLMDTRLNVASRPENEQTVVRTTPVPVHTTRHKNNLDSSWGRARDSSWETNLLNRADADDDPVWDVLSADYGAGEDEKIQSFGMSSNSLPDTRNMVSNSISPSVRMTESMERISTSLLNAIEPDLDNQIPRNVDQFAHKGNEALTMDEILRTLDLYNNPSPPKRPPATTTTSTTTARPPPPITTTTTTTTTTTMPPTVPFVPSSTASDYDGFGDPIELFFDNIDVPAINAAQSSTTQNPDIQLIDQVSDYTINDVNAKSAPKQYNFDYSEYDHYDDLLEYEKQRKSKASLSSNEIQNTDPKFILTSSKFQNLQRMASNLAKTAPVKARIGRNGVSSIDSLKANHYLNEMQIGKETANAEASPTSVASGISSRRKDFFNIAYGKSLKPTATSKLNHRQQPLPTRSSRTNNASQKQMNNLIKTTSATIATATNILNRLGKQKQQTVPKDVVHQPKLNTYQARKKQATAQNGFSSNSKTNFIAPKQFKDYINSNTGRSRPTNPPIIPVNMGAKPNVIKQNVDWLSRIDGKAFPSSQERNKPSNRLITLLMNPNPLSHASQAKLDELLKKASLEELLEVQKVIKQRESMQLNNPSTKSQQASQSAVPIRTFQHSVEELISAHSQKNHRPELIHTAHQPQQGYLNPHNANHQNPAPGYPGPNQQQHYPVPPQPHYQQLPPPHPHPPSPNHYPQQSPQYPAIPQQGPPQYQNFAPTAVPPPPPPPQDGFFNNGAIRPNLPLQGNYDAIHSSSGVMMKNSNEIDRPINDYIHGVSDDPFSYRQNSNYPPVFNAFKDGNDEIADAHAKAFESHVNKEKKQDEFEDTDGDGSYADDFETATATTFKEYDCRRKNDGTYGGGCRAFYRCEAGDTYLVECKHPYVHNRRTGHCGEPKNAPSPCGDWQDCADKDNGKYANIENGCKSYYTCQGSVFLGHNNCTPGTIFDEREQVCNWPDAVPPPCSKGKTRKPRRRTKKRKIKQ